jgi:predicted MFS family arabinose efflux permease
LAFSAVERHLPAFRTYQLLPFVLAAGLALIALDDNSPAAVAIVTFALCGLGCSALLPLTISFGEEQLVSISAAAAGLIIAFYQIGYGLAAFGTGTLLDAGVSLSRLFGVSAALAVAMGVVARVITAGRRQDPASDG